jgi:predicted GNAT family N-acyltransferase
MIWSANPSQIIGYYTLSATVVRLEDFPPDVIKRLPRYPNVPATLIGRLALDRQSRGQGLGEKLLMDALARSARVSAAVASAAVVVDAKDSEAETFYSNYGFIPLPSSSNPVRLFLPIATIRDAFMS